MFLPILLLIFLKNTVADWERTGEFETVVVDTVFNGDPDNPGNSINHYSMKEVIDNGDPITGSHQLSTKNFCYVGDGGLDASRYKHCSPFYNKGTWKSDNGDTDTAMLGLSSFPGSYRDFGSYRRSKYSTQPDQYTSSSATWPGTRAVYASTGADVPIELGGKFVRGVTSTGTMGTGQILRNDGTVRFPISGNPNGCNSLPGDDGYGWRDSDPTGSSGTNGLNPYVSHYPGEYLFNHDYGTYGDYNIWEVPAQMDWCFYTATGIGAMAQRHTYAEIDADADQIGDGQDYVVTKQNLHPRGATLGVNQDGKMWWAYNTVNRRQSSGNYIHANGLIDPHPSQYHASAGSTVGGWPSNQVGGYATGHYYQSTTANPLSTESGWSAECGQTLTDADGLGHPAWALGYGDTRQDYCMCLCELGSWSPDADHTVILDTAICQQKADEKFGSSMTKTVETVAWQSRPYGCSAEWDSAASKYTVRVNTNSAGQLWFGGAWDNTRIATWHFTDYTESPTVSPTSSPTEASLQCLTNGDNAVSMQNPYLFNGVAAGSRIGMNVGTYTFTGIDANHPFGIYITDPTKIEFVSGTFHSTVGSYDYYTGTVVYRVLGDFGTISYGCAIHGFMGGENNLQFNSDCSTPAPTSNPTESPTQGPTSNPTESPTQGPTKNPTQSPTTSPTANTCCELEKCYDDHDGDGVPSYIEGYDVDTDGDGILDYLDVDDDNDSILTEFERGPDGFNAQDRDGDGIPDHLDPDDDNDGVLTIIEVEGDVSSPTDGTSARDTDGDGLQNWLDVDDDGDGILTIDEAGGVPGDGYITHIEARTCATGGTIEDNANCASATQAKRRLKQLGESVDMIDIRPVLV